MRATAAEPERARAQPKRERHLIRNSLHACLFGSALMLWFGFAAASTGESVPAAASETSDLWFVELSGAPVADGKTLQSVRDEKAAFRQAASAARIRYTERHSFDTLFNGFSVKVAPADRAALAALPGVRAMYPVAIVQAPTPEVSSGAAPDLATAIAMTGANLAQSSLGYTGAGVRVAVLDTGIDVDHPDLGGPGFPNARVTHGRDFVGDAFNADPASPSYNPVPVPDANPDDCNGHGTHVAGIVGADGLIKGVAPGVTFGAYRVFGCEGSTTTDVIIAAMERALADGNDILNISVGSAYQWPQYPTALAANRLVRRGMVVVASIGNNGANGLYSASAPGLGARVIGTAAFDNTAVTLSQFTISPDDTLIGYSTMTDSVAAPTTGSLPMARTGTTDSTDDACAALPAGSLAGMAALIRRGSCGFAVKAANAQSAGAAAVIIYNNAAGRFNGTIAGGGVTIPTVQIADTEGALIDGRLAAGPVAMTWRAGVSSFTNPTGGLISSSSSYGLSPDLALKPDIGAPGGMIYSTYPLEQGGYATLSGTSMASPHVAGAAALLLQARPMTPAQTVRNVLQNSADPQNWWGNPGLGLLDDVHRQGAGMLDIDDAILATTTVEPATIAAGEGAAGPYRQPLMISNLGTDAVTYDLSFVNALSTGGVMTPSFFVSNASVAFAAPSVTVRARRRARVWVEITPATAPVNGQYGGYIVLTPQGGGQVYRVPFAGFVGDYQGITVLTPTANGFPWLAQLSGDSYFNRPAGATYTMTGTDFPYFLVHLDHQARHMEFQILKAATLEPVHPQRSNGDEFEFLPRNSTENGFFSFAWDGKTYPRQRPGPAGPSKAAAGRAIRRRPESPQGAWEKSQPGALGDLDLTGDHHRPTVGGFQPPAAGPQDGGVPFAVFASACCGPSRSALPLPGGGPGPAQEPTRASVRSNSGPATSSSGGAACGEMPRGPGLEFAAPGVRATLPALPPRRGPPGCPRRGSRARARSPSDGARRSPAGARCPASRRRRAGSASAVSVFGSTPSSRAATAR